MEYLWVLNPFPLILMAGLQAMAILMISMLSFTMSATLIWSLPLQRCWILAEKHDNGILIFKQVCSSGTSAAELFYFWMKRFNRISLLFMDEFDAYYHFELAEKIISIIRIYPDMQMIFTTHNTLLMGNDIIRPDCYFFLNKVVLKSYVDRAGSREI